MHLHHLVQLRIASAVALLGGQVVVSREAITHDNPAKAAPDQLDGGGRRSTQALEEHRHQSGDLAPVPASLPIGIVAVGIAGGAPVSST